MSAVIPLSKPIKAHGDEVSEISLREPTTKDIIELGLPTLIIPGADGQSTGVEIRQPVVARYISRLAAIPMGSVEALAVKDFSLCTAAVMGFFGSGDGEAPTT
ncbi:MAG: phage tail assembly protein [Betaproteobacteria bacterium]|nr:phage tail assembly protein [Betaproteobacteria bacterium]